MSEPRSVYVGDLPPEEGARLNAFAYPNQLSRRLLADDILRNPLVADLGAGPNTDLGRWVSSEGFYVALDIRPEFVAAQRAAGFTAFEGSVAALPKDFPPVHIAHARFLFMHLSDAEREAGVREMLRVAMDAILVIDFDYKPWGGSAAVDRLHGLILEVFQRNTGVVRTHSDFFFGSHLMGGSIIDKLAEKEGFVHIEKTRVSRPRGAYYHELVGTPDEPGVGDMTLARVRAEIKKGTLAASYEEEFAGVLRGIREEAAQPDPPGFVPPDVVVVRAGRR